MSNINFDALLERQAEISVEIDLLSDIDKSKADLVKPLIERLTAEKTEIDCKIQSNQKQIDLNVIGKSKEFSAIPETIQRLMVGQGIDYNVRCYFDFVFSTGQVTGSIKPAVIRSSKESLIVYNGREMPDSITVNLSDNKHETETFQLCSLLEDGSEFSTWESLYQSFLDCFTDLKMCVDTYNSDFTSRTGKKSRFESASAKTGKLQRLTQGKIDLVLFADVVPTGTGGDHTETASQATIEE